MKVFGKNKFTEYTYTWAGKNACCVFTARHENRVLNVEQENYYTRWRLKRIFLFFKIEFIKYRFNTKHLLSRFSRMWTSR